MKVSGFSSHNNHFFSSPKMSESSTGANFRNVLMFCQIIKLKMIKENTSFIYNISKMTLTLRNIINKNLVT